MFNMSFKSKPYAILHKQLCDNYIKCPSMLACENKSRLMGHSPAIYMDEQNKIAIHKECCIACKSCMEQCGLFRIASSIYKEMEFQTEFDNDPRNGMNFLAERFGCDNIDRTEYCLRDLKEVWAYIRESAENVNMLEFVDESHVMCPFQAIEVDFIRSQFPILNQYKKYVISAENRGDFDEIYRAFSINQFPAILLLTKGGVFSSPIIAEYRVRQEEDRIKIQAALQNEIAKRLERWGA